MALHVIRKGLDLPLAGDPKQEVERLDQSRVAVVASDFIGMKPRMEVMAGESVRRATCCLKTANVPGFSRPRLRNGSGGQPREQRCKALSSN